MIFEAVHESAAAGKFPLILGGDHSLSAGSVAGVLKARPNTRVVWVDAHADLNTPATSPSGNMHGMPLGLLMRDLVECVAAMPTPPSCRAPLTHGALQPAPPAWL